MSTVRVSAEERDALHDLLLDKLSGIDDLGLAISRKDFRKAEYLAQLYHDYLTVVLVDLGWRDHGDAAGRFTSPPEVLARVCGRLREAAESPHDFLEKDRSAAEELEGRNRLVLEACNRLLSSQSFVCDSR
jgi:hypothetical protein